MDGDKAPYCSFDMEIVGDSDRWHPRSGKGCGDDLLDIPALDCGDRDDLDPKDGGEFSAINLDPPFCSFVHHVQDHYKGFFEFCDLQE